MRKLGILVHLDSDGDERPVVGAIELPSGASNPARTARGG
ncbi:MAG: hypothetical protein RL077_1298 [Verrucomicrobiota bacterium]|jgi:hypothetical protein